MGYSEGINKLQSILEKKNRYVFGYEIGQNCEFKSPAQAFVERLYTYESDIRNTKDEVKKNELMGDRNLFLATFRRELQPEESVLDMLNTALLICKAKETEAYIQINSDKKLTSKDFQNTEGEKYINDLKHEVGEKYSSMSSLILHIIECIKDNSSLNEQVK